MFNNQTLHFWKFLIWRVLGAISIIHFYAEFSQNLYHHNIESWLKCRNFFLNFRKMAWEFVCSAALLPDTKILEKWCKLKDKIGYKSFLERFSKWFSVCVGVFVSDHCNFKNNREKFFFKFQKFLQYKLDQFDKKSRSWKSKSATPTAFIIKYFVRSSACLIMPIQCRNVEKISIFELTSNILYPLRG